MKKFFSSLLIAIFCLNIFNFNNLYANIDKNYYNKNVIIYKTELNKTSKGRNYVKQIDNFIEKLKNNEELLNRLNNNLENLLKEQDIKNNEIINTLNYLHASINIALINLSENRINQVLNPTINENDKNFAKEKILLFQKNIINSGEDFIETIFKDFLDENNYKEVGDLNINFKLDQEYIGKIDAEINLNNYEAINYNLDSKIKGDFSTFINIDSKDEQINFELSSLIDFILKDGNYYLLFDNLNFSSNEYLDEINEVISKVKKLAEERQYIKYSDYQTEAMFSILETLNYKKIFNDARKIAEEPLFEAYKKVGNKYYIIPTKYACDNVKELVNKFDPFFGKNCSNSQYDELIKGFIENGDFYLVFENNLTTIGFEGKNKNYEKNKGHITFSTTKIEEVKYEIKDNYGELTFEYNYGKKFNIEFNSNNSHLHFIGDLNSNNEFNKIDFELFVKNYLESNIKIENKSISGVTKILDNGMDIAKITTTGAYSKDKFKLYNKIELSEIIRSIEMFKGINGGNFNFNIDQENNKNNFYLLFDILDDSKEIIKLEINSTSNREKNNLQIEKPSNYIDYKEAFGIEDYYYYYY